MLLFNVVDGIEDISSLKSASIKQSLKINSKFFMFVVMRFIASMRKS